MMLFPFRPTLVQTYYWDQLPAASMDPVWPRRFVGTAQRGYKLGVAHRNTAIYSSLFAGGTLYTLCGRPRLGGRSHPSRRRYLAPWLLAVLLMALDGGSHLVSEVRGWGFGLDNAWLRPMTGGVLPNAFYVGYGLGFFQLTHAHADGSTDGSDHGLAHTTDRRKGIRRTASQP